MQDRRRRLLARCYLKLGEWQEAIQGITEESIPAVLRYYAASTDHDAGWYKAWHAWAYMNFESVLFYKQQQTTAIENSQPKPAMVRSVIFFKAHIEMREVLPVLRD